MEHKKRMAGNYAIIQAFHIGDREVVLGENPSDTTGQRYLCAFCQIKGSNRPLKGADCTLLSSEDDLNGKVIVIKADVLRREYRTAQHQLKLCVGGFGASPHSRGSLDELQIARSKPQKEAER